MKKLILIMLGAVFLSGCYYNTKQHKVEIQQVKKHGDSNKMYIASYPAELRGTYYSGNKSCAEPAPDVATSEYVKYLRKLQEAGITSENSGEKNTSVKELAGRDSTVLITRELLFRICEMGLNYPNDNESVGATRAKVLYGEVLKVLVALARGKEANVADAETGKVNAQAKATNAETQKIIYSTIQTQLENKELKEEERKAFIQQIKVF